MAEEIKTKRCSGVARCKILPHLVPITGFYRDRTAKDGLQASCRTCQKASVAAARAEDPGRIKERARERDAKPERKAQKAEASATYRVKYSKKVKEKQDQVKSTPPGRALKMIANAKHRNKNKNFVLPFELSEHVEEITKTLETGCELSGLSFDLSPGTHKPDSPSIDQIVAGNGYSLSNSRVICWALNCLFQKWGEEASIPIVLAWLERSKSPLVAAWFKKHSLAKP